IPLTDWRSIMKGLTAFVCLAFATSVCFGSPQVAPCPVPPPAAAVPEPVSTIPPKREHPVLDKCATAVLVAEVGVFVVATAPLWVPMVAVSRWQKARDHKQESQQVLVPQNN